MTKKNRFSLQRYYPDLIKKHYSPTEIEEWKAIYILEASRQYKNRFLSGDENAIFHFVKAYSESLREIWSFPNGSTIPCYSKNNIFPGGHGRSWVIEQIEKWKSEDTKQAREKLMKLFKAYVDGRGAKRKSPEEDLRIYNQIKKSLMKTKNLPKAIWAVVDKNNKIDNEFDRKRQVLLLEKAEDIRQKKEVRDLIAKENNIPKRKLIAFVKSGSSIFNTYKEIYYEVEKLVKMKKYVFGE